MDTQSEAIDLREYARLLLRRRWTVILVAAFVVAVAMALTLTQTPVYRATTDLAIEPVSQAGDASLEELLLPNTLVETERRVITSLAVATRVRDMLELDAAPRDLLDQVTVATIRDTRVVQISVDDVDPGRAAAVSVGFANAYLTQRRDTAVQALQDAVSDLQAQADDVRAQIAQVGRDLGAETNPDDRAALEIQRQGLAAQLANINTQVLAVGSTQQVRGGGTILNPAERPASPASPKPLRTGVLAGVLGLMLGVGAALLRDYLDDAIRSDDDLKRATGGFSVLGRIPHWDEAGDKRRAATLVAPRSVVAEAYRALRTNIRFLLATSNRDRDRARAGGADLLGGPGKTLLVTSATAGDGKTSTAANVAISFARAGRRVVLVDADMRKPRIGEVFGVPGGDGLSDAIAGLSSVESVEQDVGVENLRVVTSGEIPPNPAELLGSPGMRSVQYDLERRYDIVVVDSPPVLAVADALEIGPYAHGVLLVAAAGRASRRAVHSASENLGAVGATLLGTVLNDIDEGDSYYGYKYYYTDYAEASGGSDLASEGTPEDRPKAWSGRRRGSRSEART